MGLLGALLLAFSPGVGADEWRGYLQLSGFTGESTDAGHAGWSDVQAFDEGIEAVTVGNRVNGSVKFRPLNLTRTLDRSSPGLFLAAARGQVIDSGTLELRRVAKGNPELLRIELKGIQIGSVTVKGVAGEPVVEQLSLTFREIAINSVKITGKIVRLAALASTGSRSEVDPDQTMLSSGLGGVGGLGSEAELGLLLNRNLLRNPGAEDSAGDPLGWLAEGGIRSAAYGEAGISGVVGHGAYVFTLAQESETGAGGQTIDLNAWASAIDTGQLRTVLAGWFGGGGDESTAARLVALFRDSAGSEVGGFRLSSALEDPSVRSPGPVRWETASRIPPGTRFAEVTLELHRSATGGAQVYADDLSLVVESQSTGSGELPLRIGSVRTVGGVEQSMIHLSWVPPAGGVVVETATRLEGPWRLEAVETRKADGLETCTVPAGDGASVRFWRVRSAAAAR